MVVVSDLPADSPAYRSGSLRTNQAIEHLKTGLPADKTEDIQAQNHGAANPAENAGIARPGSTLPRASVTAEKVNGQVRPPVSTASTAGQLAPVCQSNSGAGSGAGGGVEKARQQPATIINLPSNIAVKAASSIAQQPESHSEPPIRSRIPGRPPTSILKTTASKEQRSESK